MGFVYIIGLIASVWLILSSIKTLSESDWWFTVVGIFFFGFFLLVLFGG